MSTGQRPDFFVASKHPATRLKSAKGRTESSEIQDQDRHGNHMGGGFPQFSGNQSHAAFSFCKAKPALYFHAFTFIKVIPRFVPGLALPGPAQCRTG